MAAPITLLFASLLIPLSLGELIGNNSKPSPSTTSTSVLPTATDFQDPSVPLDFDVSFSVAEQNITIPQPAGNVATASITLGCKNCSSSGTITVKNDELDIDTRALEAWMSSSSDSDDDFAMFTSGSLALEFKNFSAHIELEATMSGQLEYTVAGIPSIPIPGLGWGFPGAGNLGVSFTPAITVAMNVPVPATFSFGFDLTVPDGSALNISLVQFSQSVVTGFNESTITALPFHMENKDIEMTVDIGFQPQIQMGIDFMAAKLAAGIYVNLPQQKTRFSQVTASNQACGFATNTTQFDQDAIKAVGNITQIEPTVVFDYGINYELSANFNGRKIGDSKTLGAFKDATFPTQCLALNQTDSKIVLAEDLFKGEVEKLKAEAEAAAKATSTSASISTSTGPASTPTGQTEKKQGGSAASSLVNPFRLSNLLGSWQGLSQLTGFVLFMVAVCFSMA